MASTAPGKSAHVFYAMKANSNLGVLKTLAALGFNLVATATRDKRKLAAIVFGSNSGKARADLAQMLLTDGFARKPAGTAPKVSAIANAARISGAAGLSRETRSLHSEKERRP